MNVAKYHTKSQPHLLELIYHTEVTNVITVDYDKDQDDC